MGCWAVEAVSLLATAFSIIRLYPCNHIESVLPALLEALCSDTDPLVALERKQVRHFCLRIGVFSG